MRGSEDLSNPVAKNAARQTAGAASLLEAHMTRRGADADPLIELVTLNASARKAAPPTGNNARALANLRAASATGTARST